MDNWFIYVVLLVLLVLALALVHEGAYENGYRKGRDDERYGRQR